jgi:hypothetical protein
MGTKASSRSSSMVSRQFLALVASPSIPARSHFVSVPASATKIASTPSGNGVEAIFVSAALNRGDR